MLIEGNMGNESKIKELQHKIEEIEQRIEKNTSRLDFIEYEQGEILTSSKEKILLEDIQEISNQNLFHKKRLINCHQKKGYYTFVFGARDSKQVTRMINAVNQDDRKIDVTFEPIESNEYEYTVDVTLV